MSSRCSRIMAAPRVSVKSTQRAAGAQHLAALPPQIGGVTIVVNSLHHANRQRFTLAHELGHFELHMTEFGSAVHVDK